MDAYSTMERRIFERLPAEEDVVALKKIPVSPRQLAQEMGFYYDSIRQAIKRMRKDGLLMMERDGMQFLYARKKGAKPPEDGRGKCVRRKR